MFHSVYKRDTGVCWVSEMRSEQK